MGSSHARAVKHRGDAVDNVSRDAEILLLDFNQDAEDPAVIGEVHKALCIDDRGEPRLDCDPAMPKQFHDGRRVGFRQVHRSMVGQFVPPGDGSAGRFLVVLDPGSRRHADKRARTRLANGRNGCIHSRQAFPSVRSAGVDMQFGCAGGDAGCAIERHGLRGERKSRVEVAGTCAVEAGLNDHVGCTSAKRRWSGLPKGKGFKHGSRQVGDL